MTSINVIETRFYSTNSTTGTNNDDDKVSDIIFEDAISDANMKNCIDKLKEVKIPINRRGSARKRDGESRGHAAVFVPFCRNNFNEVCLLLTLRSTRLSNHKAQMSFPGGFEETVDNGDIIKTALRETSEELDIR